MRSVVMLLLILAVAASVEASFAAAPGFSGRVADCTSCHIPPLEGEPAVVRVDGIPTAWDIDTAYQWAVAVEGGPTHIPTGPIAGFEMEVLDGTLAAGAGDEETVRGFHDRQATYTETGVYQRSWNVVWTAPDLDYRPMAITVWVAGMAANGNHDTQFNRSDLGEHGDAVHNTSYVIPPSDATVQAWRDLPLRAPEITSVHRDGAEFTIEGRMRDGNATTLAAHDGTRWIERSVGPTWRLVIATEQDIRLKVLGAERQSPELILDVKTGHIQPNDAAPADHASPAPLALLPILLIAFLRRHP